MRLSAQGTSTASIAALIVSNLVPLFGVLFLGWSLHMVIIMFWIESGIIGAFNVVKIAMARGIGDATSGRVRFTVNGRSADSMGSMPRALLVPFFMFHYGLDRPWRLRVPAAGLRRAGNAHIRGTRDASPGAQMFSVHGRVVVLHATILGGAFLVGRLGTPLAALAILVVGKILVDLGFHVREHRRAHATAPLAAHA